MRIQEYLWIGIVSFFVLMIIGFVNAQSSLFYDDFNDGNDDGWTVINGNWYVENGKYVQDLIEGTGGNWKYTKADFTGENYNFEADITPLTDVSIGGCTILGYIDGEYNPSYEHIALTVFPRTNQISLYVIEGGNTEEYIHYLPLTLGQEYHVKAIIKDGSIDVFLDGDQIITGKPTSLEGGNLYLVSDDTHCLFDNINVTSNEELPDCVIPTDGMVITEDTKFCPGTYNLPSGITIGADDVTLDCNNAILIGNSQGYGIKVGNVQYITVRNCKVSNFSVGLYATREINYGVKHSLFENIFANYNIIGILITESENNTFRYIETNYNRHEGFVIQELSNNNQIINCKSENSNYGTGHGIGLYLSESNNNLIKNCSFKNNDDHNIIIMRASSNNVIEDCILEYSLYGLTTISLPLYGDSTNNLISSNIFNNTINMDLAYFKNNTIISNDFYYGPLQGDIENNIFCIDCVGNNYYDGATGPTCPAECFETPDVVCGDTITEDTILTNDILDCPGNGIIIGADNITLDCNGHTIDGDNSGMNDGGIHLNDSKNIIIKNCVISQFYYGISSAFGSDNILRNNVVNDNIFHGIHLDGDNNELINNTIKYNKVAIVFMSGSNNILTGNIIEDNEHGILLSGSSATDENGEMFIIASTNNNTLVNNIINNNDDYGIHIWEHSKYHNIWNNDFYVTGINVWDLENNTFCMDCVGNNYYDGATGPTCPESCLADDCVIPTDGMDITEDTTFCQGEYYLPNGILIAANNVILDCNGAVLKNENNSSTYLYGEPYSNSYISGGLIILRGDNNVIKNCVILNSSTGINDRVVGGPYPIGTWCRDNNSLINNTIISNKYNGIRLCGNNNLIKDNFIINNSKFFSFNGGIFISGSNNLVKGNYVENNYNRNIWINGGFKTTWHSNGSVSVKIYGINNTIENNYISVGSFGIDSTHYSKIINNVITYQSDGINLGRFNHIENNTFLNNSMGIDTFCCGNNTIVNNKFDSNLFGISLGSYIQTSNNTITKNIFKNNKYYAIAVYKSSFNNSIWDNDIYDTGIFDLNESLNIYCVDCIGNNYYDGATGPMCPNSCLDSDNDGIPNDEDKCPNTEGDQIVYGCSCNQILDLKPGKDKSSKCSPGIIKVFTKKIGWAKYLFE